MVQQHISLNCDSDAANTFVKGKQNIFQKFISCVLKRHQWSVWKITISQSVPIGWHQKAEENSARIRGKFREEYVDAVVNADKTFLLCHPFCEKLIAPTGIKHVGSTVQVDNEKWGATVMIACEFHTSSILPPMDILTGVHCVKLMTQWAQFSKGKSQFPKLFLILFPCICFNLCCSFPF
jgi:hypothetical protein